MTAARMHVTYRSGNTKTGPLTVTTTSRESCPTACPLQGDGGCYADAGWHLRNHWDKVTTGARGAAWDDAVRAIMDGPAVSERVRLNQAGDLPSLEGRPGVIDGPAVARLLAALFARGARVVFTYTHHRPTPRNVATLRGLMADYPGFVCNLSANGPEHARLLREAFPDLPVATILPDADRPAGTAVCPAQLSDHVTCSSCGGARGPLCGRRDRPVVGFVPHGARARKAAAVAAA